VWPEDPSASKPKNCFTLSEDQGTLGLAGEAMDFDYFLLQMRRLEDSHITRSFGLPCPQGKNTDGILFKPLIERNHLGQDGERIPAFIFNLLHPPLTKNVCIYPAEYGEKDQILSFLNRYGAPRTIHPPITTKMMPVIHNDSTPRYL